MSEILAGTLVIAMVTNMIMMLPYYNRLRKFGKPFTCAYCMSFWFAIIIGLFGLHDLTTLQWLFVTLATPFVSEILNRIKTLLPISL